MLRSCIRLTKTLCGQLRTFSPYAGSRIHTWAGRFLSNEVL